MIVDKITKYIAGNPNYNALLEKEVGELASWSFKRQFMERDDSKGGLRLSSAGKCARALAYDHLGFETSGKEIDVRGRMVFFFGDMIENAITCLAKLAGVDITHTGKDQLSVSMDVNGTKIEGHPDGVVNGNVLFECKSMTSYSFSDFEKGIVNETYLYQINAYMFCLGFTKCVLVGVNKESGVIHELILEIDQKKVDFVRQNLKVVLESTKEKLPDRAFKASDKGLYPWNCAYCSHYKTCLIDTGMAERVVVGRAYKLKSLSQ